MSLRLLTLYTQFLLTSTDQTKEWVPSLDLPLPQTIEFCPQLPIFDNKPLSLTLASFATQVAGKRRFNSFTWAASNYLPLCVKQSYDDLVKAALPRGETIAQLDRLAKKSTPLLVADMGDYGYGLFAKAKISKGSLVCTYTGKLIPSDYNFENRVDRCYTVGVQSSSLLTAVFQVDPEAAVGDFEITVDRSRSFPAFIDGSEYGNYGSFLQHLPSVATLASSSDRENIATANLITIGADYRYYPCYYFQAARDIEANEILGFDYGENYWRGLDVTPVLFDCFGRRQV